MEMWTSPCHKIIDHRKELNSALLSSYHSKVRKKIRILFGNRRPFPLKLRTIYTRTIWESSERTLEKKRGSSSSSVAFAMQMPFTRACRGRGARDREQLSQFLPVPRALPHSQQLILISLPFLVTNTASLKLSLPVRFSDTAAPALLVRAPALRLPHTGRAFPGSLSQASGTSLDTLSPLVSTVLPPTPQPQHPCLGLLLASTLMVRVLLFSPYF